MSSIIFRDFEAITFTVRFWEKAYDRTDNGYREMTWGGGGKNIKTNLTIYCRPFERNKWEHHSQNKKL